MMYHITLCSSICHILLLAVNTSVFYKMPQSLISTGKMHLLITFEKRVLFLEILHNLQCLTGSVLKWR